MADHCIATPRRVWGIRLILLAAILFLLPAAALGRAGGGQGYGGGGGGGHGGGGGGGWGGGGHGGGGGSSVDDLVSLVQIIIFLVQHPALGGTVVAGVVVFGVLAARGERTSRHNRTIRKGNAVMGARRKAEAIDRLRAADLGFDEELFYQRARAAFEKIQAAWSRQDLQSVRPFISDGIHERFSLQFQEQKDLGYRNQMDNVQVRAVQMADLQCDGPFDVLTVRVEASADDYRVALANGKRIGGTTADSEFAEYWSFLRRHGVLTRADKPSLIEGNCPNCGAAIEINQSANCKQCGAVLRSGQHDWVLVEITQESEWSPAQAREIPGVADLTQGDPEFNVQHLEDFASVIFWRRAMADRKGAVQPLRKMATAEFCQQYAQRLGQPNGRAFIGDCAVGCVETLGVIRGGEVDRAVVNVAWAGTRFVLDQANIPRPSEHRLLTHSLFVLARRATAKTAADRAISSAHCPQCGAPESDTAADACEFCGCVLNDPGLNWVLSDIVSSASPEADELHRQLGGRAAVASHRTSGSAQLAWMVQAAVADGQVTPRERQMLLTAAATRGVAPPKLERMIEAARRRQLELPQPDGLQEARQCLSAIVDVALADGAIHKDEDALLRRLADRFNYGPQDLRLLVKERRTGMLESARAALRDGRSNRN